MELVQMLTSQLGITDQQARGGTGLLLMMAKEKLGGGDFGVLAGAIPDASGMLDAEMVKKFIPVVTSFLQGQGGGAAQAALAKLRG